MAAAGVGGLRCIAEARRISERVFECREAEGLTGSTFTDTTQRPQRSSANRHPRGHPGTYKQSDRIF